MSKVDWKALAEKYRAEARGNLEKREESWQRSDTDGFLSQWALGLSASLAQERASICEHGGHAEFTVLMEGERVVDARQIDTRYGYCWRLSDDEEARFGRRFVPVDYEGRSRVQKRLGLRQGKAWRPAWAKIEGRGKGLSGTAWVATYQVHNPDPEWERDLSLIPTEKEAA